MNKLTKLFPSRSRHLRNDARGVVLTTILVVGIIVTFVTFSLVNLTVTQNATAHGNVVRANALLAAEAGIEQSLVALNVDNDFPGFVDETAFFDNQTQGRGFYQTTIESTGSDRTITSKGIVYAHNSDRILNTRTVRVTLVGTSSEGYSVYTGAGGLILSGGATITNSEIYVQGKVSLSGGAKIGSVSQPLNLNVANIACPDRSNPGPTYPSLCPGSSQAVTVTDWTENSIVGNVCATNQTQFKFPDSQWNTTLQVSDGNGNNGFIPGCTAPEVSVPTYSRSDHLSRVVTTAIYASTPQYNCNGWQAGNGWTRTWPAHVSFTGSATIASSCLINLNGDVHFTGDLTLAGGSTLVVPDSAGTVEPVIMVDGNIDIGAGTRVLPNSSGTTLKFVSTKAAAACSPNCTSLTGTELYNSQNTTTIRVDGGAKTPGVTAQSLWGKVFIGGGAELGAVVGQKVEISGGGSIVFGRTLSSGKSTWTIRSYQQLNE